MEVAALVVAIVSAIAFVGTLLLVARQARSLAHQTALANKLAVHAATNDAMTSLRSIGRIFIEYPELRRYFYDGAQLSDTELHADSGVRVQTIAELLADTLERVTESTTSIDAPAHDRVAWDDAIAHYLSASPAFRTVVTAHPDWWPILNNRMHTAQHTRVSNEN